MFFWRRGSGSGRTTLPRPRVRSRFKVTGDWQPTASLWLPGTVPYTSLRERASLRLPDQLPTGLKILRGGCVAAAPHRGCPFAWVTKVSDLRLEFQAPSFFFEFKMNDPLNNSTAPSPTNNVGGTDDRGLFVSIAASLLLGSLVFFTALRLSIRYPFALLFGSDDAANVLSMVSSDTK